MTTIRTESARQSDRVAFRMPIEVSWYGSGGVLVKQQAVTLLISRNGGGIRLTERLDQGQGPDLRRPIGADAGAAASSRGARNSPPEPDARQSAGAGVHPASRFSGRSRGLRRSVEGRHRVSQPERISARYASRSGGAVYAGDGRHLRADTHCIFATHSERWTLPSRRRISARARLTSREPAIDVFQDNELMTASAGWFGYCFCSSPNHSSAFARWFAFP